MSIKTIYYGVLTALSVVGGTIAQLLGGWDNYLAVLVFIISADYATGVICALVWKKSPKTDNGAFESNASIKGLFRKIGILLAVAIGYKLDSLAGTEFIRTAVITFFIANDGMSIVENLGIMGLPLPPALKNAFEALKGKSETE